MRDETDHPIGYCSPPKDSRFKQGTSGNPRGRPKEQPDQWTNFIRVLNRKVAVKGSAQKITIHEALFRRLRELVLKGDRRALDMQQKIFDAAGVPKEKLPGPVDLTEAKEDLRKLLFPNGEDEAMSNDESEAKGG